MTDVVPSFETYVGIDYSGAQTPGSSLPGLRIYSNGPLPGYFKPSLDAPGRKRAQIEGWIVGVA